MLSSLSVPLSSLLWAKAEPAEGAELGARKEKEKEKEKGKEKKRTKERAPKKQLAGGNNDNNDGRANKLKLSPPLDSQLSTITTAATTTTTAKTRSLCL